MRQLTGGSGSGFEALLIGDCHLFRSLAQNRDLDRFHRAQREAAEQTAVADLIAIAPGSKHGRRDCRGPGHLQGSMPSPSDLDLRALLRALMRAACFASSFANSRISLVRSASNRINLARSASNRVSRASTALVSFCMEFSLQHETPPTDETESRGARICIASDQKILWE